MTVTKYGVVKSGDPNTKFGKYFVFGTHPNPFHPSDDPNTFHLYLDDRSIEGGIYFSGGMVTETPPPGTTSKPHYHDYLEYLALLGTNPEDQTDLGGEFFIYIEDEKHVYDKTCVIAIPPKTWHCPFGFDRVDRPILFYSCSDGPRLYEHISRDPKWSHLPDPPKTDMILEPDPEMENY